MSEPDLGPAMGNQAMSLRAAGLAGNAPSASHTDRGYRRRPKAKYESGAPPKELMTTTAAAHAHFGPRISLAGRRLRSMSAAVLRLASAAAATMSRPRVRLLRSLHFLKAMTSSAYMAGIT